MSNKVSPKTRLFYIVIKMTDIKIYNRVKDFIESQFKVNLTHYQEMLLQYCLDDEIQDKLSSLYGEGKK